MNTILQQSIFNLAKEIVNYNLVDLGDLTNSNDLFKMLLEMGSKVLSHQWISVDEDLPPYDKDVFVRFISRFPNNPNEFEIGYCTRWRTKDETVKTDPKGFSVVGNMEITHWMEIPSLKGGEE